MGFIRELLELRGIPAAGKTTLSKRMIEIHPNLARVNKDDLRAMLRGAGYASRDEALVRACEVACVMTAARLGYSLVIDDVNLPITEHWKRIASEAGLKHFYQDVVVTVSEAIRRDSLREHPVGAGAIVKTAKSIRPQTPSPSELPDSSPSVRKAKMER